MSKSAKLHTNEDTRGSGLSVPSLWNAPFRTLLLFGRLARDDLAELAQRYKKTLSGFSIALSVFFVLHFIPLFTSQILQIDQVLLFGLFWIGLGVLSSVGLGTGLHTFVLYLGPKIVRFVLASQECHALAVMLPERFALFPSFACPNKSDGPEPTIWNVLQAIQLEAFLWGLGTAIGELPPYVISRAARLQGSQVEELEELERHRAETSLFTRVKLKLFGYVKQNAFVTVLLLASFPNPLFDLAGLTCGHLLVPFWTFFIATMIGKAVVKVHLQVVSIIFLFSRRQIDLILNYIQGSLDPASGRIVAEFVERQRRSLLIGADSASEPGSSWLGTIWNVLLTSMILYFVASIVNSRVTQHFTENIKIK